MNLRHIEIFHALYVKGSVSAAARALNVSQPSVSKMFLINRPPGALAADFLKTLGSILDTP
jgi:DNA-binding transcriptional regulator YdaS (Cro superfamily)